MAFIGNTVTTQGFTPAIDYFNGNGSTVTFTLSRPVASVASLIVTVDNVIQNPATAFTVSGNSITFSSAPLSGTNNIWVEYTSPITQTLGLTQNPSVVGDMTLTGGIYAVGSFGSGYSDGTVVDYVTGNGRITVGPSDDLTFYHGGYYSRSPLMTLSYAGNSTLYNNLAVTGGLNVTGNVGIGTTSPSYKLHVYGSDNSVSSAQIRTQNANAGALVQTGLFATNGTNTAQFSLAGTGYAGYGMYSANEAIVYNSSNINLMADGSGVIKFAAGGNTERMRIDSSGNLLVKTSSTSFTNTGIQLNNGGTTSQYAAAFYNGIYGTSFGLPAFVGNANGTYWFGIGNDSGTANAQTLRIGTVIADSTNGWYWQGGYFAVKGGAYTNASDYRLKTNIIPLTDNVLDKLMLANPVSFNMIQKDENDELVDTRKEIGFIAHEIQALFPEFVVGEKDAVDLNGNIDAQSVDYAKLTAILTKAIQEQQTIINDLKARIETLENK